MSEKIVVMRKVADWIEEYNWKVYFNQENRDGYPTFHSSPNSKPDLLARKNKYNILIEVKPGEKHQKILNGFQQTLEYAGEYWTGRTIYYTKNKDKQIPIDAFVFATEYSIDGYLYGKERNTGCINYTGYLAKKKKMDEYPITHSITRFTWRSWESSFAQKYYRDIRRGKAGKETKLPQKPKVGSIVAKTSYKTKQSTKHPYLFLNSNHFVPMGCKEIGVFDD